MKLLIVRHGDPNYEIDSLTEKGWREAELLSKRIAALEVKDFYVSPLGRAKDTASVTLKKINRTAEELSWLREFQGTVIDEETGKRRMCWDFLPEKWAVEPQNYHKDTWLHTPQMSSANVKEEAEYVHTELDQLMEKHGYKREGNLYRVVKRNRDTIVFFCHFGVECVILGHLLGISPVVLWHNFCAAPTSVTTVITEERREGIVSFRVNSFGDISHLYAGNEEPAFAARFCETFDSDERHD